MTQETVAVAVALSAKAQENTPLWGIGLSAETMGKAVSLGASWGVVSHTCQFTDAQFTTAVPASIIGLMPYTDANRYVLEQEVSVAGAAIPVFAGIFASDQFRTHASILRDLRRAGYDCVQNYPSVGILSPPFASLLDQLGMGYAHEVEFIRLAVQRDFYASALVFDSDQAVEMAKAGAHMIVFHPGVNSDGDYREWNQSIRKKLSAVREAAHAINPGIMVSCMCFSPGERNVQAVEPGIGVQYDECL